MICKSCVPGSVSEIACISCKGEVVARVCDDNTIRCGACSHKIAEYGGEVAFGASGEIRIKCKHKERGKTCNKINHISV